MNQDSINDKVAQEKHLEEFKKNTKNLYAELIQDIQEGKTEQSEIKINQLSAEELELLVKETQAYKALGTASSEKHVLASVSNLRERYLKKLITTAMVSFLFQMESEYEVDQEDLTNPPNEEDFMEDGVVQVEELNYDKFYNEALVAKFQELFPNQLDVVVYKDMENQLNEDDLMEVANAANKSMEDLNTPKKTLNRSKYNEAIETAIKDQSSSERTVINKFLKRFFHYDPVEHVQEGLEPNVNGDPEREDTSKYEHIPPNDTHVRFNSFYEINYEKLRQATLDIYNVKPDLEHAMIVYDVVDTQKDVDSFVSKYGASSRHDILAFPLNCWTLMGPFKQNLERVDYYNKNNAIVKSMLEKVEEDNTLKEELLKKRVKTKKVRSERIFGKDSPEFEQYRKHNPSELETKYNITMEETKEGDIKVIKEITVDAETGEELKLDEDGVPLTALEVPVTSINAQTGETSQTRFFTQAEQ